MPKIGNVGFVNKTLKENNLQAKKKFGQNFLTDQNILSGIVNAGEITKNDAVIEIGPGLGALTEHLCEAAGFVLAYEIDTDLLAYEGKIQSDYIDYTNDLTGGFFDVSDFYKTFDNNIKTILFSKSEEWGYEQEYRFVTKDFSYLDISNAITAIYCGCRMCNTHIKHIESFGYETKKMKLALLSRRLTDGLL